MRISSAHLGKSMPRAGSIRSSGSGETQSSLSLLLSQVFSINDSSVNRLPNIPDKAIQAIIQFETEDRTIARVARSKINGQDPTETDGWLEFNEASITLNTRPEILAYRLRRLDGVTSLRGSVAFYG